MTERLYFADAYLTEFDANVVAHGTLNGQPAIALDRSAFYPEGGGQPADRGMIGGALVIDVQLEGERIWHVLATAEALSDIPLGASVRGTIDWARRLDHMQQHCGQHILTAAFLCACDLPTVSFHLGEELCTIDLDASNLSEAQVRAAEDLANAVVWEGRPVTARFVDPAELARLPLRKPAGEFSHVRVVAVQGFDYSACGGTHPHSSAGVGLISVQRWQRQRGQVRVEFVCGMRALRTLRRLNALASTAAGTLSISAEELPAATERLIATQRTQAKTIEQLRHDLDIHEAERLYQSGLAVGMVRVIRATIADASPERLRALAQRIAARPGTVALLGGVGERIALVAACAADSAFDAQLLLQAGLAILGGRGGGTPRLAQGGGPSAGDLDAALDAMLAATRAQP